MGVPSVRFTDSDNLYQMLSMGGWRVLDSSETKSFEVGQFEALSTFPGRFSVISPSRMANWPFTTT